MNRIWKQVVIDCLKKKLSRHLKGVTDEEHIHISQDMMADIPIKCLLNTGLPPHRQAGLLHFNYVSNLTATFSNLNL
jgi:hypothetical protein